VPEEALSAFNGENPNGVWTLTVRDDYDDLDSGVLASWNLRLRMLRCAPGAPTNVTAKPGNTSATVGWTAPMGTVGTPITSYTATAKPSGRKCTVKATVGTSCAITKLRNGTTYTVTVTAKNAAGSSKPSRRSNTVVPRVIN
jgi:hypothetical protein